MKSARRAAAIGTALVLGAQAMLHAHAAFAQRSTFAARQAISTATGAALQMDAGRALRILRATPADGFVGEDAKFRTCMLERFETSSVPIVSSGIGDPFVRDVLRAYQAYWGRTLVTPSERERNEAELLGALRALPGPAAASAAEFDAVEPILSRELRARGYYSLQGATQPLRS